MSDRLKLVEHIKELIAQDPEGYANDKKLEIVAERLACLLSR